MWYRLLPFVSCLIAAFVITGCSDGTNPEDTLYIEAPTTENAGSGEVEGGEHADEDSGREAESGNNEGSGNAEGSTGSATDPDTARDDLPLLSELLKDQQDLARFVEAMVISPELHELLADTGGDYTVFAPTNAAIDELFESLGDPYNGFADFESSLEKEAIQQLVAYHVASRSIAVGQLTEGQIPTLLAGETIWVGQDAKGWYVMDGFLRKSYMDLAVLEASNGYIYRIDKILVPEVVRDYLF